MSSWRFTDIDIESRVTIPRLPGVVPRILALLDAGAPVRQVAPLIERDPALMIGVLQTCSSALYKCGSVGSIAQAVLLLGFRQVRSLVVVAAAERLYSELSSEERAVWQHHREVAALAVALAERFAPRTRDDLAIAAQLHDLGQIVLGRSDDLYWPILAGIDRRARLAVEVERYTFSHADLGALLAERWQLPAAVQSILFYHHDLDGARRHEPALLPSLACLSLADHFVHERHDAERRDPAERDALVAPAMEVLGLERERLDELEGIAAETGAAAAA